MNEDYQYNSELVEHWSKNFIESIRGRLYNWTRNWLMAQNPVRGQSMG